MSLVDNRTEINDCEDDNIDFVTTGSALGTNTAAGNLFENAASVQALHSNVYDDTYTIDDSGGTLLNIDMTDVTCYLLAKDDGLGLSSVASAMIVLGDGTDRIGYTVGGSDAIGMPVRRQFSCYKLDVSVVIAAPGTADVDHHVFAGVEANLAHNSITQFGWGTLHSAKAQGNVANLWLDRFTYIANGSYAVTIQGGSSGTPETMSDAVGDDETAGIGLFANPLGSQFQFIGPTEWGTPSGTADSYFTATDEQWYWLGDNSGGHAVAATHFPFRLIGNATGTNSWVLERVVIVNTSTRAQFDMSDSNMDIVKLTAVTFIDLGVLTFPVQDVGNKFCDNGIFINCDKMDLQSLDMDGNTWIGSNDVDGAIAWDENTTDVANQDNSTFVSGGSGHAIEIAPTGTGPFTYNISGYVFDGFAGQSGTDTDRVFFINPPVSDPAIDEDITINVTDGSAINIQGGGEGFSYRTVAAYTGTVSINQTVTLTVTVVDSDGAVVEGARVRIENASSGALITQGETNASGVYSDGTYNYGGDVNVTTKVRLKGFKNFRTAGLIEGTGISVGVTLQTDDIVDLP
jgi:hypothetical protein